MRYGLRKLSVALLLVGGCGGGMRDRDGGDGAGGDGAGDATNHGDATTDGAMDKGVKEVAGDTGDAAVDQKPDAPINVLPFGCIDAWPAFTPVAKAAPVVAQPRVLWSMPLPSGSIVEPVVTAVAGGAAVAAGDTLVVVDAGGNVTASIARPQANFARVSAAAAGADDSLFFADATAVYRVDSHGREIWKRPVGPSQAGEFAASGWPLIDPAGRIHVATLDGNLWTIASEDGAVISTTSVGLINGLPRVIQVGVANVLLVNRPNSSASTGRSLGAFSLATRSWAGEIYDGAGWLPENAIVGFQIGIVAYGYRSILDETSETVVLDHCGAVRWRVPGAYTRPLVVTFDDDLVVRDRIPLGGGSYQHSLRRFSRDGLLLAGPVASDLPSATAVGADDTTYLVACSPTQTSVVAVDSSLNRLWSVQLEPTIGCAKGAVLDSQGKLFVLGSAATLLAVQTTSPGPAMVSWARNLGRDADSTWWLSTP